MMRPVQRVSDFATDERVSSRASWLGRCGVFSRRSTGVAVVRVGYTHRDHLASACEQLTTDATQRKTPVNRLVPWHPPWGAGYPTGPDRDESTKRSTARRMSHRPSSQGDGGSFGEVGVTHQEPSPKRTNY